MTKEGYGAKLWQNMKFDVRCIHRGARVGFLADAFHRKLCSNWVSYCNFAIRMTLWSSLNSMKQISYCLVCSMLPKALWNSRRMWEVRCTRRVRSYQGGGGGGAEFAKQLEEIDKMFKPMKAFARHLGLLSQGQKRPGQSELQGPLPKWHFRPRQAKETSQTLFAYSTDTHGGRSKGQGRGQRGHPTGCPKITS